MRVEVQIVPAQASLGHSRVQIGQWKWDALPPCDQVSVYRIDDLLPLFCRVSGYYTLAVDFGGDVVRNMAEPQDVVGDSQRRLAERALGVGEAIVQLVACLDGK